MKKVFKNSSNCGKCFTLLKTNLVAQNVVNVSGEAMYLKKILWIM